MDGGHWSAKAVQTLIIGLVTWAAMRWVPARNGLVRVGIGFAVVGALTTLAMWWMVVPEVILVAVS